MHKAMGVSWRRSWLAGMAGVLISMPLLAATAQAPGRVVSLGGDITETVYALEAGSALVGVDSTSLWPEAAKQLPDVGYVRQLSAEGVLALHPQLIIATHDAGPAAVIEQLRSAGAHIEMFPVSRAPQDVIAKIQGIGHLLGRDRQAEALAAKVTGEYAELAASVAAMPHHPRTLFLMSAGGGSPMAAGQHTAADSAMALAGGQNVAASYSGYKPVSPEALVAMAPEVILLMRERSEEVGGIDGVLKLPGIAQTPAGKARHILFVDGQALLGFGPRSAAQAQALQHTLAGVTP